VLGKGEGCCVAETALLGKGEGCCVAETAVLGKGEGCCVAETATNPFIVPQLLLLLFPDDKRITSSKPRRHGKCEVAIA